MAAVQLREGIQFDPRQFEAFLKAQPDLGYKWWPKFVRVSSALPASHTNKIQKAVLQDAAWLVSALHLTACNRIHDSSDLI